MTSAILWGSSFVLNTTTAFSQNFASVVALRNGSFVGVWVHDRIGSDNTDGNTIRGQIVGADGAKRGAEFVINTQTQSHVEDPKVAMLSDGRFVVVWVNHSFEQDAGYGIFARVFQENGAPAGNEFLVNTTGANYAAEPSVTALSQGGFAVSFTDQDDDIRVQGFTASLERSGGEVLANPQTDGFQDTSTVVGLTGNYAVFYTDHEGDSTIRGRVLDNSASQGGQADFVIPQSDLAHGPGAAALPDGRIVVTWTEQGEFTQGFYAQVVKAQILNVDGTKWGGEIVVGSPGLGSSFRPVVTALIDGGFAIAYSNGKPGISNSEDLRLAAFDAAGGSTGADILIADINNTSAKAITTLADGRVVVSWDDFSDGDSIDGREVHAQIVDPRQKAVALNGSPTNDYSFGTAFGDTLKGAVGDDRLEGRNGNDVLWGEHGADVLMGDAGWDVLRGGSGRDTLSGGQDRDIFVFDTAVTRRRNANVDAIIDFNGKEDRIYLDNAIFKALGRKGSWSKPVKLTTEAFWAGHRAHEADDRIIYRKTTGQVFYDADGSGKGAAILIARLEKQLKFVDAGDFFVI